MDTSTTTRSLRKRKTSEVGVDNKPGSNSTLMVTRSHVKRLSLSQNAEPTNSNEKSNEPKKESRRTSKSIDSTSNIESRRTARLSTTLQTPSETPRGTNTVEHSASLKTTRRSTKLLEVETNVQNSQTNIEPDKKNLKVSRRSSRLESELTNENSYNETVQKNNKMKKLDAVKIVDGEASDNSVKVGTQSKQSSSKKSNQKKHVRQSKDEDVDDISVLKEDIGPIQSVSRKKERTSDISVSDHCASTKLKKIPEFEIDEHDLRSSSDGCVLETNTKYPVETRTGVSVKSSIKTEKKGEKIKELSSESAQRTKKSSKGSVSSELESEIEISHTTKSEIRETVSEKRKSKLADNSPSGVNESVKDVVLDSDVDESNNIECIPISNSSTSVPKRTPDSSSIKKYSNKMASTSDNKNTQSSPKLSLSHEELKSSSPSKRASFDAENSNQKVGNESKSNIIKNSVLPKNTRNSSDDSENVEEKVSSTNVQNGKSPLQNDKNISKVTKNSSPGFILEKDKFSRKGVPELNSLLKESKKSPQSKKFTVEDFQTARRLNQQNKFSKSINSCQDSDSDAESRKAIMESAQRRIEQNLSTSESDSRHFLKTVHKPSFPGAEDGSSDSESAPDDISFESSRKTAMESLKNAVESIQREKQRKKAKRKERLEKLKQQKEEKLIRLKEKLASQEDASCSSSEESGYEEVAYETKRTKKKKALKSKTLKTEKENVDGSSVPPSKKTYFSDVESDDSTTKKKVSSQLPSVGNLKRLPSDVLDSLPDQIPMKVQKVAPSGLTQEEKSKKKRKKEKSEPQDSRDFKKPANLDYIPLESSGATKFGVVPLEKAMKTPITVAQQAANFRQNMLFGSRIRREPNSNLAVYQKKRKAATDKFVR